jgi:hypothetical protein
MYQDPLSVSIRASCIVALAVMNVDISAERGDRHVRNVENVAPIERIGQFYVRPWFPTNEAVAVHNPNLPTLPKGQPPSVP